MSTDNTRRPGSANPSEDGGKEPARSQSQAGPTYDNPNEGQEYQAPETGTEGTDGADKQR